MALFDSGNPVANVELSNTFNTWRIRTNQIITQAAGLSSNNVFSGTLNTFGAIQANTIAGNLTGNVTGNLTGNVTGNLTGNVTGNLTGNASTATTLATARTIGGVSFDGSANINLPGVNQAGNQNTSGNAATATILATARTIGGVSFNGSANINLPGVNTTGNQNTTGTAANVTGTVAVANGGTGRTSLTAGNLLLGDGTNAVEISSLLTKVAGVTQGSYLKGVGYADTIVALGNTGTAKNIDIHQGGVFTATLTGNCTFTFRYPVASGASSLTLFLTNDGTPNRTVAFAGGTFLFPLGAANLNRTTAANATDVWVFTTLDGGNTYVGNLAFKDIKV